MKASQQPTKFPIGFGASAGGAYIRAIPQASQIGIQAGAASLTDGFPPLTFQSEAAGGVPPFGEDFNGILNQLSLWCQWVTAGSPVFYNSSFSASIGGYPSGALLNQLANPRFYWVSLVDDNPSNPDTGGANWYDTSKIVVGGVLSGTLPNPSLASGAAATNVGTLGGSLTGTLPNPGIANSGVTPAQYNAAFVIVTADGRITSAANAPYPTYTTLKSGAGATYTLPGAVKRLKIRMVGGGGGGSTFTGGQSGGNGTQSAFGSSTAFGGGGGTYAGNPGSGGTGGTTGTGTEIFRQRGSGGGAGGVINGATGMTWAGGMGGASPFGGAGGSQLFSASPALANGAANSGSGGGGELFGASGSVTGMTGGASGEYVEFVINNPAASYIYTVGAGGTAGTNAGTGGSGVILIEENYY